MLIGVKKRFVFIANSKTASTSIESTLVTHAEIQRGGYSQRKHIYLRNALIEYDFLFGRKGFGIDRFFTFGVMRDPVDWITSWYRYRKGNKVESPLPPKMSLAEFWALNDWNRSFPDGTPRLQRSFFTDANDNPIVDYIIPYEALDSHFAVICRALKVNAPLREENVSALKEAEVPPALAEEMRAFYANDYALRAQIPQINAAGLAKLAARQIKNGAASTHK